MVDSSGITTSPSPQGKPATLADILAPSKGPTANVEKAPDQLLNQRQPVKVQGEVVQQNRDGSVKVDTPKGEIILRSDAKLAAGQKVDLTIQPGKQPLQALLNKISSPQTQSGQIQNTAQSLQSGQILNAQAFPQNGMTPTQSMKMLIEMIMQQPALLQQLQTLPAAGKQSQPMAMLFKLITGQSLTQGGSPASGSPLTSSGSPQTTGFSMQLLSANKPDGTPHFPQMQNSPASSSLLSSMKPLTGTVTNFTQSGQPIITMQTGSTPISFVMQEASGSLQKGSSLQFILTAKGGSNTSQAALQSAAKLPFSPLSGTTWPALDELIATLRQIEAPAASNLTNVLPQTATSGTRFAGSMLFFLAAIRGGDVSAMMNDRALLALRNEGRMDLVGRLNTDFQAITRQSGEPLTGEWRAMPLPLMADEQLQRLQLYFRHQGEDGQHQDGLDPDKRQTRFIIDLKLSRIGEMQIDGLMRPENPRLDIILRTEEAFSAAMRQTFRQKYSNLMETTKLDGELSFQSDKTHWLDFTPKPENLGVTA